MNEIGNLIVDVLENRVEPDRPYICKYCNKGFRKESTLTSHMCESRRRAMQEKEPGVQLGFRAYLRFFEHTQGSSSNKTYTDFCKSPYYIAFVKFGRHIVSIRAINTKGFIDFVIKNNKKLDHWCHDKIYQEFLCSHLKTENVQDALERSIKTMTDWANNNDSVFNHYFLYVNTNKVAQDISNGRVSSWIVYNCDSGIQMLDRLNAEQIEIVFPYIDPDYWKRKFHNYYDDTEWVKGILKEAKL